MDGMRLVIKIQLKVFWPSSARGSLRLAKHFRAVRRLKVAVFVPDTSYQLLLRCRDKPLDAYDRDRIFSDISSRLSHGPIAELSAGLVRC